jgi:hypothetical protein
MILSSVRKSGSPFLQHNQKFGMIAVPGGYLCDQKKYATRAGTAHLQAAEDIEQTIPSWMDRATRAFVKDIIGVLSERHSDSMRYTSLR